MIYSHLVPLGNSPDEIFAINSAPVVTFSDIQGGYTGASNIDANPLFINAPGDLRLQAGSPCIDTGNNSVVTESTDLDGNARIVNSTVDMGAYENRSAGAPLIHNLTQGTFFNTIQAAIADTGTLNGDVIEVAPWTYYERINFLGKAITLQSTHPSNPAVVAATIIDGGAAGTVVTCNNFETSTTVLDGFTITNGCGRILAEGAVGQRRITDA